MQTASKNTHPDYNIKDDKTIGQHHCLQDRLNTYKEPFRKKK
jgi:hypothetical protein